MPKSLTYRAQSPFHVDEAARILLDRADDGGAEAWEARVVDRFGKTGVKSEILG